MDLTGKKLLILGGNAISEEIVQAAKTLGVYTIVTDWNSPDKSPAKLIADEYWNDSLMDYDTIVPKIREHHVDGIITGFTDSYLLPYQHLCELTGLPCYASKETFELTMDKARFKQACRDNGVEVIPQYHLESFDPSVINASHKVIIKPIDNSGSRGVVLCSSADEFQQCLDYALSFSNKKEVLIEQYMELDSVSASYTAQDGVLSLSTFNDRYVHKAANGGAVTNLSIYPSKYIGQYIEHHDARVRQMFTSMGIRDGIMSIQFFTDGTHFYAMEMGHRLTGGQHYLFPMYVNGVNSLHCLIHYALTGSMADYKIAERDNPRFPQTCCHLIILGKEAKIGRIEGLDYLQKLKGLIHLSLHKKEGDTIGKDGTSAQKVVHIHLAVPSRTNLRSLIDDIRRHFHIYDQQGNDITIIAQ